MEIQGFNVERSLGVGATSEVFAATNLTTGKRVALKSFSQLILSDPELVQRLETEVEILGKLRHSNVVTLLSHQRGAESFVLELELVDGFDLRRWIESYDLQLVEPQLWTLAQIARGLGAAHELGIVHRDLKPENILVSKDGEVKITDFGLARQINRLTITRLGLLIGSLGYMAPEVVNGGRATDRADLFSFGVIAYEVLCRRPAFPGETPQAVIRQITEGKFEPIRSINPRVPPNIASTIESCLKIDPKERPQSIWFLEAELMTYLSISGLLQFARDLVSVDMRGVVLRDALLAKHQQLNARITKLRETDDRKELVATVSEMLALFPDDSATIELLPSLREKEPSRWRFMAAMVLFALAGAVAFSVVALKNRSSSNTVVQSGPAELRSGAPAMGAPPMASGVTVSDAVLSGSTPSDRSTGPAAELRAMPNFEHKTAGPRNRARTDTTVARERVANPAPGRGVSELMPERPASGRQANLRRAQPSLPKFGSIRFDVDPDVQIYVNDGWVPPNEFANYPIVVGRHRVRMAKAGYMPIESSVEVTEGKTAVIRARGNQ